ncbi:MAG TPA: DUF5679 domain-containing protein [Dehalococcoidales bacterium]|nr:DUF5679 domain-containing protein [Dehalococcoidales bacterium]
MVEGFCFKCKKKVGINSPTEMSMKNNRKAIAGTCPICNAKVYTFGRSSTAVRVSDRTRR